MTGRRVQQLGYLVLRLRGTQKPLITKHGHQDLSFLPWNMKLKSCYYLKPQVTSQMWWCMPLNFSLWEGETRLSLCSKPPRCTY